MLGGILNWKWYLGISIVTAAIVYLIGLVDTGFIERSLLQLRGAAINVGMIPGIADFVVRPVIAAFNGDIVGAVIAGFMWPFMFVWLLLLTGLFFFATIGSGFDQAANSIRQ